MQMIIDDLRQRGADSVHLRQIRHSCPYDSLQPTEVMQQLAALCRTQARHRFEYRLLVATCASTAMPLDGKAVRLVAHSLDQPQGL